MGCKRIFTVLCLVFIGSYAYGLSVGDFNGDGIVDHNDLSRMSASWLAQPGSGNYDAICDLAGTSAVDFKDLAAFAPDWLKENVPTNWGFELGDFSTWSKTGTAWGDAPVSSDIYAVSDEGNFHANSRVNGNTATGTLTSSPFILTEYGVNMLIAGFHYRPQIEQPYHHNYVVLKRASDDAELDRVYAPQTRDFNFADISSPENVGELVYIQAVDNGDGGANSWMAIDKVNVDHSFSTLYVNDFGAVADDGIDDTDAIRAALYDAQIFTPCEIIFGAGTYNLSDMITSDGKYDINIRGQENYATKIIQNNPTAGIFSFFNFNNIEVSDLVIDYDPVCFTQGTISELDTSNNSFTYTIDDGYRELDDPFFDSTDFRLGEYQYSDPALRGRVPAKAYSFTTLNSYTKIGRGVYRVFVTRTTNVIDGYKFIYLRKGSTLFTGLARDGNGDIYFDRIKIYSGSGIGFVGLGIHKTYIDDCHILYRPGTTDRITLVATGAHFQSCAEGPEITNCIFEGITDDAVNMYGQGLLIYGVTSPTQYQVDILSKPFNVGDSLRAFRPSTGTISDNDVIVTAINGTLTLFGKTCYDITVDPAPSFTITPGQDADRFYDNNYRCNNFKVDNNTFRDLRGRGITVKSSNGTIANNILSELSGIAIDICNAVPFNEGLRSENIEVTGNIITNCCWQMDEIGAFYTGVIRIAAQRSNWFPAASYNFNNNILVRDNEIYGWSRHAIFVSNSTQVNIIDNVLANTTFGPKSTSGRRGTIFLDKCKDIDITYNDIDDTRNSGDIDGRILRKDTDSSEIFSYGNSWYTPNWTGDDIISVTSY